MSDDERLIRRAIALAASARRHGNHPFGALLAVEGTVVLESENTVGTDHDPTRHAELNLLQSGWRDLDRVRMEAATLYASTEPCPMCLAAIHYSRLRRVVYSVSQRDLAARTGGRFAVSAAALLEAGTHPTEVIGPVLPDEGRKVLEGFWE